MQRSYVIGLFVALVCVVPVMSSALTAEELQTQINRLLEQISSLTSQLRSIQERAGTEAAVQAVTDVISRAGYQHRVCSVLSRNLSVGVSGDDVRALQEMLQSQGFLAVAPTGYFGELTQAALQRWQASQGVVSSGSPATTGWGLLGPRTRTQMQLWCGTGSTGGGTVQQQRFSASPLSGSAPLSVTFSSWLSGFRPQSIYYTIDFGDGTSERAADCLAPADACVSPGTNTHTYSTDGTYEATLNQIIDPCVGQPACAAAVHKQVVAKVVVHVGTLLCTQDYAPVCGAKPVVCIMAPCNPVPTTYSNRCAMASDGATLLYEGQCRDTAVDPSTNPQCKSWYDGCNTCSRSTPGGPAMCTLRACLLESMSRPYCTGYFDTSSTNHAPTISGFSGPTTLAVGEMGTWTVRASDPENEELSYYISWGDEGSYATGLQSALPVFIQNATFTHTYGAPGTYTVKVIARDSAGKESSVGITVSVRGGTTDVIACTADAKQCPDGTWVGRTGPNCEFVCPALQQCARDPYCSCDAAGNVVLCS